MNQLRSRTRSAAAVRASVSALLVAGVLSTLASHTGASAAARPDPGASAKKTLAYLVPAGVHLITVDLAGSRGTDVFCGGVAGNGGRVVATIPVSPGETLQMNVGDNFRGSQSGNASDIRRSPYGLADRLVVGGGGGNNSDHGGLRGMGCKTVYGGPGMGGDGGAPAGRPGTGEAANLCDFPAGHGGRGGTLTGGGAGGGTCGPGGTGVHGTFGFGGAGGDSGQVGVAPCDWGGKGGDGWYGGGGGGGTLGAVDSPLGGCTDSSGQIIATVIAGGGGGGSSHAVPAAVFVRYQPGFNSDIVGWVKIAVAHRPSVTALSSHAGTVAGGRTVTIRGSHLKGSTVVRFGNKRAGHLVVVSATKITVRSPAHGAGTVDVRVSTSGGTSARVKADRYTYR